MAKYPGVARGFDDCALRSSGSRTDGYGTNPVLGLKTYNNQGRELTCEPQVKGQTPSALPLRSQKL